MKVGACLHRQGVLNHSRIIVHLKHRKIPRCQRLASAARFKCRYFWLRDANFLIADFRRPVMFGGGIWSRMYAGM